RPLDVGASHGAVAGDVGVDDGGDAGILYVAGELEGRDQRLLGPALDGDTAVAGVDADGDAPRVPPARLLDQRRVLDRDGAEDDALDVELEPEVDGRHVADAAAHLHRYVDGLDDGGDRCFVDRLALDGAVEVDDV